MEDVLTRLGEKQIIEIMYSTMIKESEKLNSLRHKLLLGLNPGIGNKLKEKYELCLNEAKKKFEVLEREINEQLSKFKPVKIYLDGVFDIIHTGHFNAMRQAKKLGDILLCGVNGDEDVTKAKGKPLMDVHERAALAAASKWTNEYQIDTPYSPTCETLEKYNCDFLSHGDDIPRNEKGESCLDNIIKAKKIRLIQRTEGISTTVIIGRLLLSLKDKVDALDDRIPENKKIKEDYEEIKKCQELKKSSLSSNVTTSWRIKEFSNQRLPRLDEKIIYIAGDFDVLHLGHIEALEKVKKPGTFVYVGLYTDKICKKIYGKNYPILGLNERALSLLSIKYVDEIIFGAPERITKELIEHLKIDTVIKFITPQMKKEPESKLVESIYEVPRQLGIYQGVEVEKEISNEVLAERIWIEKERYIAKYIKKALKVDPVMKIDGQEVREI